jgi:SAM-dependent methyltransferase
MPPETADPSFERAWRRRFQQFGERHDDDAGIAGWSADGLQARFRNFRRLWPGRAGGARWLDAGCGAGTYTRLLAAGQASVIGLDYSLPTLRKAAARSAPGIGWVLGDVTRLPFRPGLFDGVLCFGVFQALAGCEPAVGELASAAGAGGEVWIDGLNAWSLPHLWERIRSRVGGAPARMHYVSPGRLAGLLRKHGMRRVRLYWVPILPGRWRRWQPLVETPLARSLFRWVPGLGRLFSHAFLLHASRQT